MSKNTEKKEKDEFGYYFSCATPFGNLHIRLKSQEDLDRFRTILQMCYEWHWHIKNTSEE